MRLGSLICALLVLAPRAALADGARPEAPDESAQRQESREAFYRGVAALKRQAWGEARDAFVRAYELFPHPSILLDLGIARAKLGEVVQAEQDLTRFLSEDTGATGDEMQTARSTLSDLRARLATVRLRVVPGGATATLDDKSVALVPGEFADVRVAAGSHVLHVEAPGHVAWDGKVAVEKQEAKVVDLTLAQIGETPHPGPHPRRIASYVLFGSSVAIAGFGIFAGVHSIDLANQYNTIGETHYQDPGTKSEGLTYRTLADVMIPLAITCAAVGIVLYVTAPKTAHVAIGPRGVWLEASF